VVLAPRLPWRDTSVPLSRMRLPLFVVQDRLCSVHAATAIWGGFALLTLN
jgi:hypothetical protein